MDVVVKQQKQNGDYKVQAQQLVLYCLFFFGLVVLYGHPDGGGACRGCGTGKCIGGGAGA
jgi:hypothetical protein